MKDDYVFLINDVEITLHDKPIEEYMDKHKYKQAVSECKKWHSFIKNIVGRKFTLLSKKELDTVRSEYGEIVNASEI